MFFRSEWREEVDTEKDGDPLIASLKASISEQANTIIARLMKGVDTAPLEEQLRDDFALLHLIQREDAAFQFSVPKAVAGSAPVRPAEPNGQQKHEM
jgi:hypothetical protein